MDDGTAGEMVVSANYWKEMSKNSKDRVADINNNESRKNYEDHDGELTVSNILGGVEWRWKRIATGNVKVKVAASGTEASEKWPLAYKT